MEGMFWGVAAMMVKDAVKQQYLKGRDYERNVRQVYRDVDNLKITMDHVRRNCGGEDLETGPHAPFIRRAEAQLRDAYRILRRSYPRKPGLSKLMEYASRPGAEMHLIDIGKEANQTARGLGDLLAEIRFAKIGKPPDGGGGGGGGGSGGNPPPSPLPVPHPAFYDVALYEDAVSDGMSSPRSVGSDKSSLFDRDRHLSRSRTRGSTRSHPSSTSSRSRGRSPSSRRPRSHSAATQKTLLPAPSSSSSSSSSSSRSRDKKPLPAIKEGERALDDLQHGIDSVLGARSESDAHDAMEHIERALAEVLRVQRTEGGFAGLSRADEDLGDAVEDLDEAMAGVLGARDDREKKYATRRLGQALEDVDAALAARQRRKERRAGRRLRQIADEEEEEEIAQRDQDEDEDEDGSEDRHARYPPTHAGVRRKQGGRDKSRRYSMY